MRKKGTEKRGWRNGRTEKEGRGIEEWRDKGSFSPGSLLPPFLRREPGTMAWKEERAWDQGLDRGERNGRNYTSEATTALYYIQAVSTDDCTAILPCGGQVVVLGLQ